VVLNSSTEVQYKNINLKTPCFKEKTDKESQNEMACGQLIYTGPKALKQGATSVIFGTDIE
jgi:hypothetical protein